MQAAHAAATAQAEERQAAAAEEAERMRSLLELARSQADSEAEARMHAEERCAQLQGQVEALGAQLKVRPPSSATFIRVTRSAILCALSFIKRPEGSDPKFVSAHRIESVATVVAGAHQ